MAGLFIFGFGTGLTALSALGVPPWDVLHDGLRLHSPLSFGQAAILVGLMLILISLLFGISPGVGTIANMLFIGLFIDLTLYMGDSWEIDELVLPLRLGVTIAGIALVGLGSALYIGAEMGAGPRDSLMVLITTCTRAQSRRGTHLDRGHRTRGRCVARRSPRHRDRSVRPHHRPLRAALLSLAAHGRDRRQTIARIGVSGPPHK